MTLPNETNRLTRFIHESFHEIARDEEVMDAIRDLVSIIIGKWKEFENENLTRGR